MSLIFFILAGISNSIMDTSRDHYPVSILPKGEWWDGRVSFLNKYIDRDQTKGRTKVPVQLTDAFHFFKLIMLIFLVLSVITYSPTTWTLLDELLGTFWSSVVVFSIYGLGWIIGFVGMYDKILLKKTWKN